MRRHLRAFGPAGAEDVAGWLGLRTPPVRAALAAMADDQLDRVADEDGRELADLPGAPRPGPDASAPPRLLPAFDSTLLAYAPKRRARILPDEHHDKVLGRGNLRIHPTFLVDGFVAGLWRVDVRRGEALQTLSPFARLAHADRTALVEEAERVLATMHAGAKARRVAIV